MQTSIAMEYDAFGRLMRKYYTGLQDIARYRYNGLGYRILEQRDVDGNDVLTNSERLYFIYDARWRQVESYRDQDASPKEAFIYHNAGIAGRGNSSYIDSVILRDKDANTAWTSASDGTPEERRYLVQNWRADVTTMLNTSGEPVEWYRYTTYGQPTSHAIADMNGDGDVNATDASIWDDLYAGTPNANAVWLNSDINRDDVFPDSNDDTFYYAQYSAAGSGTGSGYSRQSTYGLRKGYAGYEWDDTLEMWHVRHRVLDSKSGKWTKKDPLGYVDGMNDVEYVRSMPLAYTDAAGLMTTSECNQAKAACYNNPRVKELLKEIRELGFQPPAIQCESGDDCAGGDNGVTVPGLHYSEITLCADRLTSPDEVCQVMIHELVHALQHARSRNAFGAPAGNRKAYERWRKRYFEDPDDLANLSNCLRDEMEAYSQDGSDQGERGKYLCAAACGSCSSNPLVVSLGTDWCLNYCNLLIHPDGIPYWWVGTPGHISEKTS